MAIGYRLLGVAIVLHIGTSARLHAQTFEQRLVAVPDTASVRQMSRDLSAVPHMAGTPAQATTRDYVLDKLKSWGIDAWSKEYTVYIPQPETVAAWIIPGPRRGPVRLNLVEPGTGAQIPPFNGYTGDGNATADVVYVNYGLIEDYKTLDSLGISVQGKVAIARYGRSFRGIGEPISTERSPVMTQRYRPGRCTTCAARCAPGCLARGYCRSSRS